MPFFWSIIICAWLKSYSILFYENHKVARNLHSTWRNLLRKVWITTTAMKELLTSLVSLVELICSGFFPHLVWFPKITITRLDSFDRSFKLWVVLCSDRAASTQAADSLHSSQIVMIIWVVRSITALRPKIVQPSSRLFASICWSAHFFWFMRSIRHKKSGVHHRRRAE